jgi:hypothetical protein
VDLGDFSAENPAQVFRKGCGCTLNASLNAGQVSGIDGITGLRKTGRDIGKRPFASGTGTLQGGHGSTPYVGDEPILRIAQIKRKQNLHVALCVQRNGQ